MFVGFSLFFVMVACGWADSWILPLLFWSFSLYFIIFIATVSLYYYHTNYCFIFMPNHLIYRAILFHMYKPRILLSILSHLFLLYFNHSQESFAFFVFFNTLCFDLLSWQSRSGARKNIGNCHSTLIFLNFAVFQ